MTSKVKVASTVSALRHKHTMGNRKKRSNASNTGVGTSCPNAGATVKVQVGSSSATNTNKNASSNETKRNPVRGKPTPGGGAITPRASPSTLKTPTKIIKTPNINSRKIGRKSIMTPTSKSKSKSTGNIMKSPKSTSTAATNISPSLANSKSKSRPNMHVKNSPGSSGASVASLRVGASMKKRHSYKTSKSKEKKAQAVEATVVSSPTKSPKSPISPGGSPKLMAKKLVKSLRSKSGLKQQQQNQQNDNHHQQSRSSGSDRTNSTLAMSSTCATNDSDRRGSKSGSIVSPTSERVVMGDEKFDGIEIAMKEYSYDYRDDDGGGGRYNNERNGGKGGTGEVKEMEVELLHVLGINTSIDERGGNDDDRSALSTRSFRSFFVGDDDQYVPHDQEEFGYDATTSTRKWFSPLALPGIQHDQRVGMVDQHSTNVEYTRMTNRYHPTCDFTLQHRIPTIYSSADKKSHGHPARDDFGDKFALLQKYQSQREDEVVEKEWMRTCSEIKAVENEKTKIQMKLGVSKSDDDCEIQTQYSTLDRPGNRKKYHECTETGCGANYDIDLYLDECVIDSTHGNSHTYNKRAFKTNLSGIYQSRIKNSNTTNLWKCPDQEHRSYLQRRRGAFIHAGFQYSNHVKMFAMKCEGNTKAKGECHKSLNDCQTEFYGVEMGSSKASSVRHLAITVGEGGSASFFVSKDDGRAHYDDTVPRRLIERIEKEAMNGIKKSSNSGKGKSLSSNMRYLSCGPNGSYYAELVSGLVLWSIGRHDEEFQRVMKNLNVHRVAFGSFDIDTSWVIICKDGRVVWRNIPCRLSKKLLSRTPDMAAPAEISLGSEGTYFVRFLDGEIDYCLPAYIEDIVSKILRQGAEITSIFLHPESAHNFIIRHSMLPP